MAHVRGVAPLVLLLAFLLPGCKEDIPAPSPVDSELDRTLDELLKQNSRGAGKPYFTLPAGTELAKIPADPLNPLTQAKVDLGQLLYHETALSMDAKLPVGLGTFSCATCHFAKAGFQANLPQGISEGGTGFGRAGEGRTRHPSYTVDSIIDCQPVRSPASLNIAYQTNVLWNGQFGGTGVNRGTEYAWTPGTPKETNVLGYEGTETQAIAGQAVHRIRADSVFLCCNPVYRVMFDQAFGHLPASLRVSRITVGLAVAAYERTLLADQAPWQRWLRGDLAAMSDDEKRGAVLFFGKAGCVACHTGPALNSMTFHAIGMKNIEAATPGIFIADPARAEHRGRGGFTGRPEDMYKFKTPQLYNLVDSKYFGHGASLRTVRDVVVYKNLAVAENPAVPASQLAAEFRPLNLTGVEIDRLTLFLERSLRDPSLMRYQPTSVPSGFCFPNNDQQSRSDLGCVK